MSINGLFEVGGILFTGFKIHILKIIGPSTPFCEAIAKNGGKMAQIGRYTISHFIKK